MVNANDYERFLFLIFTIAKHLDISFYHAEIIHLRLKYL